MELKKKHLILVNAITFIRVPLIVLFFILAIWHAWPMQFKGAEKGPLALGILALVFLMLSAITDLFDGLLARRWHVETKFGAMCDPLMDKVFYLVVFPALLWLLPISLPDQKWHTLIMLILTVLYMLRDQWVTFLRSVGSQYGANCSATFLGKFRTAMTFPLCGLIYYYIMLNGSIFNIYIPQWLIYTGEAVAIFLNFWSLYVYTKLYLPYIRKSMDLEA